MASMEKSGEMEATEPRRVEAEHPQSQALPRQHSGPQHPRRKGAREGCTHTGTKVLMSWRCARTFTDERGAHGPAQHAGTHQDSRRRCDTRSAPPGPASPATAPAQQWTEKGQVALHGQCPQVVTHGYSAWRQEELLCDGQSTQRILVSAHLGSAPEDERSTDHKGCVGEWVVDQAWAGRVDLRL